MEKMLYLSIQYLRSSDKLHNSSEKTKQCVLISVSQRTRKNVKRLEEMSKKKKGNKNACWSVSHSGDEEINSKPTKLEVKNLSYNCPLTRYTE